MADTSVFITGVAEGAFEDALTGLPAWATQDTAEDIEKILKKTLALETKALTDLVKGLNKSMDKDEKNADKVANELDKLIKSIHDANVSTAKDAKNANRIGKGVKPSVDNITSTIAAVKKYGDKLTGVYQQSFTTTQNLLQAGINLTQGLNGVTDAGLAMQQMVVLTNLRLSTLEKVADKYATSLNGVGLAKFAKSVGLSSKGLTEFGYSNEQQAELIGSMIESESNYTDVRSRSSKEIATEATRLGIQLRSLSLTTGQSVTKMLENIKISSKTTDSMIVSSTWGDIAAKNVNTAIAGLKDDRLKEAILKMASAEVPELTEVFQSLVKSGQGAIAVQLAEVAKTARSTTDINQELASISNGIVSGQIRTLNIQKQAGNESAQASLEIVNGLRQNSSTLSTATQTDLKNSVDNMATRAKLQNEMEAARAAPDKTFALMNSQIDLMTSGVSKFNSAVDALNNMVSAQARSWSGFGLAAAATVIGLLSIARVASVVTRVAGFLGGSGGAAATATEAATTAGTAAAGGSVAGAAMFAGAGLAVAAPIALAGGALQDNMASPEGRARRSKVQQERLAEKKKILAAYKESGASEKAIKQIEDEIATQEKLITDLSIARTEIITSAVKQPTSSSIVTNSKDTIKESITNETNKAVQTSPIEPVKSPTTNGTAINSELTVQSGLLEQIVTGVSSLLSVNQDLLRVMRQQ